MKHEDMVIVYEAMDANTRENFDMIIRDQSPRTFYELLDLWKEAIDFIDAEVESKSNT